MSQQQAKILLEKINALQKSMDLTDGQIIPIERDLMLSYIRQLYEVYRDESTNASSRPRINVTPKPKVQKAPPPPPQEEQVAPPPPPPKVEVEAPKPKPKPTPVEYTAPAPKPAPAPTNTKAKPTITVLSSKLEQLFAIPKAKELSEKLGEQKISDLTRALAINDRLLYANSLFGKDMNLMNRVLDQLNRVSNMDEAKNLLADYAKQNNWANGETADMAKDFIKLVRRRYS